MAIILPNKKTQAKMVNPRELVIYASPKSGKTTSVALLDDCLIVDLENGTDYVDAMAVKINSLDEMKELYEAIKTAGKPYKYIAIDTLTKLEEFAEELALQMYRKTPLGKGYTGTNILNLPNGGGYGWVRQAFVVLKNMFRSMADYVIYIAHVKDKKITTDGDTEMLAVDINLTGKLATIVASYVDGIGQLKRVENKTYLSFTASETSPLMGSRSPHLSGKEFLLTEKLEDGTIIGHWDSIYIESVENVKDSYKPTNVADISNVEGLVEEKVEVVKEDNIIDQLSFEAEPPKRNIGKKKQEADAKKKTTWESPVSGKVYNLSEESVAKIITWIIDKCNGLTEQEAFDKYKIAINDNKQAMSVIDDIRGIFEEHFKS